MLLSNLLQVSMDGPNVNLSFLEKLKDDRNDNENSEQKELIFWGLVGYM